MIDRIPQDVVSPLAYLMASMGRLKDERLLEAKAIDMKMQKKISKHIRRSRYEWLLSTRGEVGCRV